MNLTTTTTTEAEADWLLALFDASPQPTALAAPASPPAAERPTCSRCSGTGRIPNFSHIKGGECFRCRGTGRGS